MDKISRYCIKRLLRIGNSLAAFSLFSKCDTVTFFFMISFGINYSLTSMQMANPKSETRGSRILVGTETRDPRPRTHLVGETRDPSPKTLKVGPKTRDLGHLFYIERKTEDSRH